MAFIQYTVYLQRLTRIRPLQKMSNNNDDGSSGRSNCDDLIKKRDRCYQKYSGESIRHVEEKCCIPKLKAKRCLAFRHCELEALQYYGHANCHTAVSTRAYCGAYEESYCFGNPRIMKIDKHGDEGDSSHKRKKQQQQRQDEIFNYHLKAKDRVLGNRQRFRDCQDVSKRLTSCLKKYA